MTTTATPPTPPPATPSPRRLAAFGHPDFRRLVTGSATSSFGSAIAPVALAFAVLALGGSVSDLGLVVAAYALAEVTTSLWGGVLGDRLPRRLMMTSSSAASAAVQLVAGLSLLGGWASVTELAVLGVLSGCLGALAGPSSQAMTRLTVPHEVLPAAVAARRIVQNVAQVAGFSIAGLLVAIVGPGPAVLVDAASYAVAAVCLSRVRVAEPPPGRGGTTVLGDLAEGAREVFSRTWLWLLIGQATVYHLLYGGVGAVLGPVVVGDALGVRAWGWALAALMLGFILGGLLNLRWRPRHPLRAGTIMLSLTACFPLALALGDRLDGSLWVLLLGALLHGLGLEVYDVGWELSVQQHVPADRLSRVFSFDTLGSYAARPLGLALTGPLAAAVGTTTWLLVVAAILGAVALLPLLVPDVRTLSRS